MLRRSIRKQTTDLRCLRVGRILSLTIPASTTWYQIIAPFKNYRKSNKAWLKIKNHLMIDDNIFTRRDNITMISASDHHWPDDVLLAGSVGPGQASSLHSTDQRNVFPWFWCVQNSATHTDQRPDHRTGQPTRGDLKVRASDSDWTVC